MAELRVRRSSRRTWLYTAIAVAAVGGLTLWLHARKDVEEGAAAVPEAAVDSAPRPRSEPAQIVPDTEIVVPR